MRRAREAPRSRSSRPRRTTGPRRRTAGRGRRRRRPAPADALLRRARVARLATADARGRPHVVPVCFAWDGRVIEIAIDEKPKRVSPERLRRVRNVRVNPHVALVADEYHEDWRRLRYVLVLGRAVILRPGGMRHASAVARLRRKYPQYRAMRLEGRPVLRVTARRVIGWAARRVM